jgi:hypothetical protein
MGRGLPEQFHSKGCLSCEPLGVSRQRLVWIYPPGRAGDHDAFEVAREARLHDRTLPDEEGDFTFTLDGEKRPYDTLKGPGTLRARHERNLVDAEELLDSLPYPLTGRGLVAQGEP